MSDSTYSDSRSVVSRPLQNDDDFWHVHKLLVECYSITPLGFNWNIRRWEGRRFYDERTDWPSAEMADRVQLWETMEGRLVAAVNPEGRGDAHLQVHPDFRHLEAEMIAWAETHLMEPTANGTGRQLEIFVFDYDEERQSTLSRCGFTKRDDIGVARRMRLAEWRAEAPTVEPTYTLRTTRSEEAADCQRIADLLNAAFKRTIHNGAEYQNFARLAPSFRSNLDLVALSPDGSFAAYVGIPYDEENRCAIFEPVCTHPDHRRHGLARALMQEGLLRLKSMNARDVIVETGDMIAANRLYDAIGFGEKCRGNIWRKVV